MMGTDCSNSTSDILLDTNPMIKLPENQNQFLNLKIKECDQLKAKNQKLQKKVKQMKSEIIDKDQIIGNYKNLSKEMRLLRDQWRMSEDLRDQQNAQIKKLQDQLFQANRENTKLKKKVGKLKEKVSNPIKVVFEEKEPSISTTKKLKKSIKD